MLSFLIENLGTIIISAVLLACFILAIRSIVKNKKSNPCGNCGSGCSSCPHAFGHKK